MSKKYIYAIKEKDDVKKEVAGISNDPNKFSNATGRVFAGADEWVFTGTRNFQVFFPDEFNKIFPHHGITDTATVLSAFALGGIYYIAHLYRIRRNTKNFSYAFVAEKLKRAHPDPKNVRNMRSFSEELDEIKAIWLELYGNQYEIFFIEEKPGDMLAYNPQLKIGVKNLATITANENVYASKKDWLTWLENTRLMKIIFNTWDFFCRNSMAYWIFWMSIAIFTGITTTLAANIGLGGLMLMLPLFIPTAYNLLKGIKKLSENEEPAARRQQRLLHEKVEKQIECANKRVMKIYFLRKHLKNLTENLQVQEDNNKNTIAELSCRLNLNKTSYPVKNILYPKSENELRYKNPGTPQPAYIKKIKSSAKKTIFSLITGFFTGYVITAFNQWPITDFLLFAGLVTSSAMLGLPGVAIAFGIIGTVSISYAVYQGTKTKQQVDENKAKIQAQSDTINYIANLEQETSRLKTSIHSRNQDVEYLINKNNRLINKLHHKELRSINLADWQRRNGYPHINNDRFFETLETKPSTSTYIKKIANRLAQWVVGAGSGMFAMRNLLLKGGIIATLFHPISLPITLVCGTILGTTYGLIKAYQYHLGKQKEHEKNFIEELDIRKESLEHEYRHLINIENALIKNSDCLTSLRNDLSQKLIEYKANKRKFANFPEKQLTSAPLSYARLKI